MYLNVKKNINDKAENTVMNLNNQKCETESGAPPEFFHWGGHMRATKDIGVAHEKQNFQFYYAVLKYMSYLENVAKTQRQKRMICRVHFLLLKLTIVSRSKLRSILPGRSSV